MKGVFHRIDFCSLCGACLTHKNRERLKKPLWNITIYSKKLKEKTGKILNKLCRKCHDENKDQY